MAAVPKVYIGCRVYSVSILRMFNPGSYKGRSITHPDATDAVSRGLWGLSQP